MNVARLQVLIDGDAKGALTALAAAKTAARSTAGVMSTTLVGATKLAAAGFASLGAQAATGGAVALTNALLPLVGVVGLLPGAAFAGAAAVGTLGLALYGLGDAFKYMGKDPEKFQAAMNKLAPSARSFVQAIKDMVPQLRQVQLDVQESLFAGLDVKLKALAGVYLPILDSAFMALAATVRRVIGEVVAFLLTSGTVSDIRAILDDVREGFANLGGAVVPIVQVVRDLAVVSATFLPAMGSAATNVADKLRDMVAAGRASGGIKDFIQGGIDTAKALGQVLGNIGGILHAVFAAGPDGAGVLTLMVSITQSVEDFLKSVQGQSALATFFTNASNAGKLLAPIIGALLSGVGQLSGVLVDVATGAAPGVLALLQSLGSSIGLLAPAATALGTALGGTFSAIAPVLPALAGAITQLVTAAAPLLPLFGQLIAQLITGLAPSVAQLMPALSGLVAAFAAALPSVVGLVTALAADLVPVISDVAGVLSGTVVPALATVAGWLTKHQGLTKTLVVGIVAVVAAWKTIQVAVGIWKAVTGAVELYRLAQQSAAFATYGMTVATEGMTGAQKLAVLSGRAWNAVTNLGVVAAGRAAAAWVAQKVAMAASAVASGVMTAAQWALNVALDANPIGLVVVALTALVGGLIYAYNHVQWFHDLVVGAWHGLKAVTVAVFGFIKDHIGTIFKALLVAVTGPVGLLALFIHDHWDQIRHVFTAGAGAIKDIAEKAFRFIKDAFLRFTPLGLIISHWHQITGFLGTAKDKIVGIFTGAGDWLKDAGKNIIQGLLDGIMDMVEAPGKGLHAALGKITDLIPDWKGPASVDAKLLTGNGRLILGSLIDGFNAALPAVQASLQGITGSLAATPVPVGLSVSAASHRYGTPASGPAAGTVYQVTQHISAGTTAKDASALKAATKSGIEELFSDARVNVRQVRG